MRPLIGCLLLSSCLCFAGPVLAQRSAAETMDRYYSVRVSVDPRGDVVDSQIQGEYPAGLLRALRATVAKVSFEPATKDGVAVPSRTSVNVHVRLEPDGNDFLARVVGVTEGGGWEMRDAPPVYPRNALRNAFNASLLVYVATRADGRLDRSRSRIERVLVTRDGSEPTPEQVRQYEPVFRKAVENAMANWRYSPDEVAGKPMPASFYLPVKFCSNSRAACDTQWSAAEPEPELSETPTSLEPTVRLAVFKPPVPDTDG